MKVIKKTVSLCAVLLCLCLTALTAAVSAVEPISGIWGMTQPEDGTYYLSGTPIGSEGSKDDRGPEKAFDCVTQTHFEALLDEPGQWCGLQFDTPYVITEIRFFPRLGNPGKLVGGRFEVSADGEEWITVYEILTKPEVDFSSAQILYPYPVSYVRYINDSIRANISEIEIYGCTEEEAKTNEAVAAIKEAMRPNIHTMSAFDTIDTIVLLLVIIAISAAGAVFIKKNTATPPGHRQL